MKNGSTLVRLLLLVVLSHAKPVIAQSNLLVNGDFEDVNTCAEYNSECGVEGWFYLKDVKAEMISNETTEKALGNNSFGIFYNWIGYEEFTPLIGAILPCNLQPEKQYHFKGIISAKLHSSLILNVGICTGEKFYVPKRPFAIDMHPQQISSLKKIPNSNYFSFECDFIATGKERYLTFGTYVKKDSLIQRNLYGAQTITVILDNFELTATDKSIPVCDAYDFQKEKIYNYNYRHKDMDYALYGKGDLGIDLSIPDSMIFTKIIPSKTITPDTLRLGDVLFDFKKAQLKPAGVQTLRKFFTGSSNTASIDSIIVEGHTDSIGTDSYNRELSLQRAMSVADWLVTNKVLTEEELVVVPFGRKRPIATNSSEKGRALNRRVELIIYRKKIN